MTFAPVALSSSFDFDGGVNLEQSSSAKLFNVLQTHMLAFEAAVRRLEELASESEILGERYQKVSLASLIRQARTPADVTAQINRQLQDLEGHEKASSQTAHFATQEIQQIRRLCPLMRSALEKEMARMVENIYRIFYSTAHWSAHALAERAHGRVPSAERIDDIVEDLTLLMTWRILSLKDEAFCKNQIQYLKARKIQLRVLHLLEINLMMVATHQSSASLRRDSDMIRSLIFGVFDPQGVAQGKRSWMDYVDGDFYFDPISGTWKQGRGAVPEVENNIGMSSPGSLGDSSRKDGHDKGFMQDFEVNGHDRHPDSIPDVIETDTPSKGDLDVGEQLQGDQEAQSATKIENGDELPELSFFNLEDDVGDDDGGAEKRQGVVGKRKRFRAKRRQMAIHVFHHTQTRSALKKSGERRKDAPDHISFAAVEVEEI